MRFFRSQRQQLIGGEKFRKYFKYAFGEVILIVMGILIALQINNWNENRKNRNKEIILLSQIQQEFQSSLRQLNTKIDQRNNIIYSEKKLLFYIDQGEVTNSDSLIHHLQRTLFIPTFNANTSDFFSARDISLIQNDSLRVLLADWPSQVDQLTEEEFEWVAYRDIHYLPFLTSHFPARNLFAGIQMDIKMMKNVFLDKSKSFDTRIGNSKDIVDIEQLILINSNDLEDHLGFSIMILELCNIQSYTVARHIEKILEQIKN